MLRLPAFTHAARRPPNSGMVCASSTRRPGLAASSSPSSRTSENGSLGSSTDALTSALTRSLTSPASGPNTSTTGRAGSGRATKPSTSAALMAVMSEVHQRSSRHHIDDALRHDDHLFRRLAVERLTHRLERQHGAFDLSLLRVSRDGHIGALLAVDLHR